ncbi:hypothetical protein BC360_04025 [Ensifer sp. LC163]|nr:hypothetical protein BC360_04025 [Ensifer sp. LC163]
MVLALRKAVKTAISKGVGLPPARAQVVQGWPINSPAMRLSQQAFGLRVSALTTWLSASQCPDPLRTEPWGARNFIVLDPDGNLILFAGPAD